MNISFFEKVGISLKKIFFIFLILISISIFLSTISSWLPFKNETTQANVTKNVDLIEFNIGSMNTEIIAENRQNVEANLVGKGKVNVRKQGDTITIESQQKWFNLFLPFKKNKLIVYIPEDYNKNMKFDIGSGNITYNGHLKQNELEHLTANAGSGNIYLKNLLITELKANVSSGNINIDSLITKNSNLDISSGNIRLNNYQGRLKANISSGNLKAHFNELTDSININVSSGNAKLDLPNEANFTLKGKIGSGKINNELPLTITKQSNHDIEGIHGTGKHEINLNVSSGKVDIY